MKRKYRRLVPWFLTAAVIVLLSAVAMNGRSGDDSMVQGSLEQYHDVRQQTRDFMAHYRSISLTPDQEAVMEEALTAIRAPCCSDRTAHTCCCDCNMAKTWWGLSKHLIADQGFNAEQVRIAVTEWFEFINPDGFSGNACYTGGCNRPFHQNGCGGMTEGHVVL